MYVSVSVSVSVSASVSVPLSSRHFINTAAGAVCYSAQLIELWHAFRKVDNK